MNKTQIYPITRASLVIYVKQPGVEGNPTAADTLESALSGIATRYAAKETAGHNFDKHIAVSGLSKDLLIDENATALDILKMILSPQYAPYFTNKTASITANKSIFEYQDVGTYNFVPAKKDFTLNPISIVCYGTNYTETTVALELPSDLVLLTLGTTGFNPTQVANKNYKQQVVGISSPFLQSVASVKDSDGNDTKRVANKKQTGMSDSIEESELVGNDYKIVSVRPKTTVTVRYYLPDIIYDDGSEDYQTCWGNKSSYPPVTLDNPGYRISWYENAAVQYDRYSKDPAGNFTTNNSIHSINGEGQSVGDVYELNGAEKVQYYGYVENGKWTISDTEPLSIPSYIYYKKFADNTVVTSPVQVKFIKHSN